MKKIILYIDCMGRGGAQRVMNNIADYLSDKNEVILVNDVFLHSSAEYSINPKIKRISLNTSKGGLVGNLKRIKKLRQIICREKPNVVLSFLGPCNIRTLIATLFLRVKKYVSVRNDPYFEYGEGLKKFFARQIFKLANGCIFQTTEAKEYFSKAVQKKSTIIWNPVGEKFFNTTWICQREEIAVVGRLQPQKNPLLALDAFALIANDFTKINLVYYGEGELKENILEKAASYGLSERVFVFGNTLDIEKYVSTARLFLMTSNFEGMPNALMEAMAMGVPCIATDCPCGGPREITSGFEDQVLVPCEDAQAIADKLYKVLSDSSAQENLTTKEKPRAQLFKTEYVMRQWIDFMGIN